MAYGVLALALGTMGCTSDSPETASSLGAHAEVPLALPWGKVVDIEVSMALFFQYDSGQVVAVGDTLNRMGGGGWAIAAVDMLRLIAAYAFPTNNGRLHPVLNDDQVIYAWTPVDGRPDRTMGGWFRGEMGPAEEGSGVPDIDPSGGVFERRPFPIPQFDPSPGPDPDPGRPQRDPPKDGDPAPSTGLEVVYHGGLLPGANAIVGRRADGVSAILVLNSDFGYAQDDPWEPRTDFDGLKLSDLKKLFTLVDAVSRRSWPGTDLFELVGYP